jgi:small subunit ribosomal protein S8
MSMTDPIGDMLTRIRNGQQIRAGSVLSPLSAFRVNVLEVLQKEGYIRGFNRENALDGKPQLRIELKYHEGEPVIRTISRVSTPGRRVYTGIANLADVCNGLGIAIISTPRGVMSDAEARAANVGGEVICNVV